jgi:hypothetical protein
MRFKAHSAKKIGIFGRGSDNGRAIGATAINEFEVPLFKLFGRETVSDIGVTFHNWQRRSSAQ